MLELNLKLLVLLALEPLEAFILLLVGCTFIQQGQAVNTGEEFLEEEKGETEK